MNENNDSAEIKVRKLTHQEREKGLKKAKKSGL